MLKKDCLFFFFYLEQKKENCLGLGSTSSSLYMLPSSPVIKIKVLNKDFWAWWLMCGLIPEKKDSGMEKEGQLTHGCVILVAMATGN